MFQNEIPTTIVVKMLGYAVSLYKVKCAKYFCGKVVVVIYHTENMLRFCEAWRQCIHDGELKQTSEG